MRYCGAWTARIAALGVAWCLGATAQDSLEGLRGRILARPATAARDGSFRELAAEALASGQVPAAMDGLATVFSRTLRRDGVVPTEAQSAMLLPAADAFVLLIHMRHTAPTVAFRADTTRWLLASDAVLRHFLDCISLHDDMPGVYRIVEALHDHDPGGRDTHRDLILALALVWDQERPLPHPQMGGKQLAVEPAITERYDYYRDLFVSRRAEIPYSRLSVTALTMVVDAPVPVSELQWVRQNVRPTSWSRKFTDIRYDEGRIARGQYQWPHGPYTLAAIEQQGGICVEQAYYASLCAKAYGVPALLFVGEGRRGPHAWFGYMKGTEKWEMDVGRYAYDKYATGFALNPQTNQPMTDHDVTFLCDQALRYEVYSGAAQQARLAFICQQLGYLAAARHAARRSIAISPLYEGPWLILESMLEKEADWTGLSDLLEEKAGAFRRYPDLTARIRTRQAEVLRQAGDVEGADRVLRRKLRDVRRDRDDLQRALVWEQVRGAYERGDQTGARKHLEDLLGKQRDEGQKVIQMLEAYLALTEDTGQTGEAVKFLKRYIPAMETRYGTTGHNRAMILRFLLRAHESNGDTAEAERLAKRIERLEK